MPKLTIVFFDAGGGHRAAAWAVRSIIEQQKRPWEVELLNIQELLDSIDPIQRIARIRLQDTYNLILRRGWTRITPQLLVVLHAAIRMWHRPVVRALEQHWRNHPSAVVLSVIPNFNRALAESIRRAMPATRFVTLLTDLADHPPHFWMEPESQYLICGTERAVEQALMIGHKQENIFLTSGMVLNPAFYSVAAIDRAAERQRLGLRPDWPTALILFGGHGSPVMFEITRSLQRAGTAVQMIVICGRSEELANRIRQIPAQKPVFVEGFTKRIDYYMPLCDFFIGKAGPGSISEALHFRLPVIVERNARTMPQERYNADWVLEKRVGIVLKSFREIEGAVRDLLSDSRLEQLRESVAAQRNRAVFEVAEILGGLMQEPPALQPCAGLQAVTGPASSS